MTAYQIKPWTQVVTPHQDIRDGKLDNAVFAASLSAVIRQDNNCPKVYKDARSLMNSYFFLNLCNKIPRTYFFLNEGVFCGAAALALRDR